jgi:hypothetical protein
LWLKQNLSVLQLRRLDDAAGVGGDAERLAEGEGLEVLVAAEARQVRR